jgi:hypothetical protein
MQEKSKMSTLTLKPPKAQPVDPIEALAEARAQEARLNKRLAEVKRQIADLPPPSMSPAARSMHGGVDVIGRRGRDAKQILSGNAIGSDDTAQPDLERERDALTDALEQLTPTISRLVIDAGIAIYARDFQGKHSKALLKKATALIALRDADADELAIATAAVRAGCFQACGGYSPLSLRPNLRNVNADALRSLLASVKNVKNAEQLL